MPDRVPPSSIPEWINALNQPPSWSLATLADPGASHEQRLHACQILIQSGVVRWTAPHLEALRAVPAVAGRAEQLIALCRNLWDVDLTDGAPIPATLARDGTAGNYWMVPANSRKTLIAFTGRAKRLSVSVYMMQRILDPFAVNVIYLFDPMDTFYMGGIGGAWTGFEATADLLRRLCDGFGGEALFCLGQSTGGYGALRYGLELEARAVLAFSPMIWQVKRSAPMGRIERATGRPVDTDDIDLRLLYRSRPRTPRTTIICGGENSRDMRSAVELSDLPGVDHRVLPNVRDHGIITNLLQANALRPLVAELLDA